MSGESSPRTPRTPSTEAALVIPVTLKSPEKIGGLEITKTKIRSQYVIFKKILTNFKLKLNINESIFTDIQKHFERLCESTMIMFALFDTVPHFKLIWVINFTIYKIINLIFSLKTQVTDINDLYEFAVRFLVCIFTACSSFINNIATLASFYPEADYDIIVARIKKWYDDTVTSKMILSCAEKDKRNTLVSIDHYSLLLNDDEYGLSTQEALRSITREARNLDDDIQRSTTKLKNIYETTKAELLPSFNSTRSQEGEKLCLPGITYLLKTDPPNTKMTNLDGADYDSLWNIINNKKQSLITREILQILEDEKKFVIGSVINKKEVPTVDCPPGEKGCNIMGGGRKTRKLNKRKLNNRKLNRTKRHRKKTKRYRSKNQQITHKRR